MGRRGRPKGIQQNKYAIGGRRPREKEPRKDEETKRGYQVTTG